MSEPETSADQPAVTKQRTHLFGTRIRGHVEILRAMTQQQVTHTAANKKRLMPGILEPVQNLQSAPRDIGPRYRMAGSRYDQWRGPFRCPYRSQ